jgi:hypothetical protein
MQRGLCQFQALSGAVPIDHRRQLASAGHLDPRLGRLRCDDAETNNSGSSGSSNNTKITTTNKNDSYSSNNNNETYLHARSRRME